MQDVYLEWTWMFLYSCTKAVMMLTKYFMLRILSRWKTYSPALAGQKRWTVYYSRNLITRTVLCDFVPFKSLRYVCSLWYVSRFCSYEVFLTIKSVQKMWNFVYHLLLLGIARHQGGATLYSHGQQAAPDRKPTVGHREASRGILWTAQEESCNSQETRRCFCSKYGQH